MNEIPEQPLAVRKRILFVDDDAEALVDARNQLTPLCPQWEFSFAHSAAKALDLMQQTRFDAVLTDLVMPQMNGLELLRKTKAIAPGAVRVILSNVTEWNTSLQLVGVAHQYLAKPCEPTEMAEAVRRAFGLRDALRNPRLHRLITQIPSLPSLPSLYLDLLAELRSDKATTASVAGIISRDLGMSAKLLQLANSAFLGLSHRVTNPSDAVLYLGVSTVQSLVLSLQIFSLFEKPKITAFSFDELWLHSWTTGLLARKIAELRSPPGVEAQECFTAGLLHDVGKLVMATSLPQGYEESMDRVRKDRLPVWEAEREVLGSSHAEVGAYLLGLWGLPDALVEAAAFHQVPAKAAHRRFDVLTAVYLANALNPQKSPTRAEAPPPLDMDYLAELGVAEDLPEWQRLAAELQG